MRQILKRPWVAAVLVGLTALAAAPALMAHASGDTIPVHVDLLDDWGFNGPTGFTAAMDTAVFHSAPAAYRADSPRQGGEWGTLIRHIKPKEYLGKRVRMTGWVKSDVDEAALWMRVDGPSGTLAFDNMSDRQITGKTDWKSYSIVLDVPSSAKAIYYGCMIGGKGTVWLDDVTFAVVSGSVPMTGEAMKGKGRPTNLGFEEVAK
jgi:hypothetical protein